MLRERTKGRFTLSSDFHNMNLITISQDSEAHQSKLWIHLIAVIELMVTPSA